MFDIGSRRLPIFDFRGVNSTFFLFANVKETQTIRKKKNKTAYNEVLKRAFFFPRNVPARVYLHT